MRKTIRIATIFSSVLTLCSCFGAEDTRIADIKNIVWRMENDFFQLKANATELNNRGEYSKIKIDNKEYNCIFGIGNGGFHVDLYNEENELISFYGDKQMFLAGTCSYSNLIKEKNKDYIYSLKAFLRNDSHDHWSCQYYDYCIDHNLEYPEYLTLYGYPI